MVSGMHSELRRRCQNNRFPAVQGFTCRELSFSPPGWGPWAGTSAGLLLVIVETTVDCLPFSSVNMMENSSESTTGKVSVIYKSFRKNC